MKFHLSCQNLNNCTIKSNLASLIEVIVFYTVRSNRMTSYIIHLTIIFFYHIGQHSMQKKDKKDSFIHNRNHLHGVVVSYRII